MVSELPRVLEEPHLYLFNRLPLSVERHQQRSILHFLSPRRRAVFAIRAPASAA